MQSGLDVAAGLLQCFTTDVWCLHCLFCSIVRFTSFLDFSTTAKI